MTDTGHLLRTDADMATGVAWLVARDPALAAAADITGPVRLRRREGGFAALLGAIVSQQVSVASADAVWSRLRQAGLTDAPACAQAGEEALAACGLSRQKRRYARALAQSGVEFDALAALPTAEVVTTLTRITGIGVWTAEIYAMFSLGRADVFAAGDLALQEAVRLTHGLEARPGEKALREMAGDWAPWRTVAATLLWQYYGVVKQREGIAT